VKKIELEYDVRWNTVTPRADCFVFEPNELYPLFPGMQVVVYSEPENYEGLSVTNGAEQIATALMRQYGIMPFQTCYVEHYSKAAAPWASPKSKPSFDVVWFTWVVVSPGCPVKIEARKPEWKPLPFTYYPALCDVLCEDVPDWIKVKVVDQIDATWKALQTPLT
jgi:hypothetical protein